jgi:hypothetical protein
MALRIHLGINEQTICRYLQFPNKINYIKKKKKSCLIMDMTFSYTVPEVPPHVQMTLDIEKRIG